MAARRGRHSVAAMESHAASPTPSKRARGRHGRAAAGHTGRNAIAGVIAALLVCGLYGWFAPAPKIPLPKSETVCRVVSGGTLRAGTTNCGLLIVRGHEDLIAGYDYKVTHTGRVAWSFEAVKRG